MTPGFVRKGLHTLGRSPFDLRLVYLGLKLKVRQDGGSDCYKHSRGYTWLAYLLKKEAPDED